MKNEFNLPASIAFTLAPAAGSTAAEQCIHVKDQIVGIPSSR